MPDVDEQIREIEEEIRLDEQAESVGEFFSSAESEEIREKRREREAKKNRKVDYAAAGQFMSIQEKRAEREAKKNSKVNYDIAGRFMSDEYKRKERADKKAAPKNEPLDLGDFFETDEEKLLRTYVDNKNKHIKELKEKAETQKAAVAKVSKGKRKKIADIEERDKHIAEHEAALKKQSTAIESARFEIESIKKSKENLISSRKTKSNTEIEQGENKEKSSVEIKAAEKAVSARKEIIQAVTTKKEQAQQQLQSLKAAEEKKGLEDAKSKAVSDIAGKVEGISNEAKAFLTGESGETASEKAQEGMEDKTAEPVKNNKKKKQEKPEGNKEENSAETEEKEEEEKTKAETEEVQETVKEAESGQVAAKKVETEPEPISSQDALTSIKQEELIKIIKAADEMLKSQNEELAKEEATLKEKQKELEAAEAQKKQAGEDVKSIEAQIAKYDELLKQKEEELQKLEALYKEDTKGWDEYKEGQEERKKEKWYQDYLAEKNKLDAINSEIASDEEALASAQSQDGTRFKFKIAGESGNGHTILIDSKTGEGTTLEEKTSEDEAVAEETKVEEALKNAPVLKDLNKDEIPKYISYNPKTGEMGGVTKDNGKTNEAAKEAQKESGESSENDTSKGAEEEAKAVDKILSHKTTAFLDEKLKPLTGFEPIKTLTTDLRDNGLEKAHKTVIDIMGKVRDDKTEATGQASQIMTLIMTSIDVLLDGDKDDNVLAKLESAAAEKIGSKISKQKVYNLLLKGLDLYYPKEAPKQEKATEEQKQKETKPRSDMETATDFIASNKKNVQDTMKVITKSIDTHKLLGEAKAFKGKNDQFARMIEGAYRQQVGDTTASAINTGLNFAQSAVNTFAGLGDGVLSKVINGAVTGIGMLTNKVASAIAQKRDKSKVLDSPEVLGNIKYDEKKVPDYRFNAILKRVSGITSKDGLYNVVKVTDAVTLHSNMKANKADPIVGRVMGDIGFKDQTEFDKVKVTDILSRTGHPTGDWRGELKKSMVDNGQTTKKTFGQKVKGLAKKAWGGIKKLFTPNKVEAD